MQILSVSEYNKLLKDYLEDEVGELAIEGEVSEFRIYKDRLVYFYLKDKQSQMLIFMMLWDLKISLEEGTQVRVLGHPSVFTKRGELHFRAREVELLGEGALRRALEFTRRKLEAEGIFLKDRKRPLPKFPERIGLITSRQAAAYSDVLRVLKNRWGGLRIFFYPVAVQGLGAVKEITEALEYFSRKKNVDVVILTRGGGSLEDLQTFNNEAVVRAVFASAVPVICGVGHERDESLADYAADMRAATPSNAAELVAPERKEIKGEVEYLVKQIINSFNFTLSSRRHKLKHFLNQIILYFKRRSDALGVVIENFYKNFELFKQQLKRNREAVRQNIFGIETAFFRKIRFYKDLVQSEMRVIRSLDPQKLLARGYSIIRNTKGKIICKADQVYLKEKLRIQLWQGFLVSRIISKKNKNS